MTRIYTEVTPPPLGAVLAGGAGSRLGGAKATAELDGRPLVSYPLAALANARLKATRCPSRTRTRVPSTSNTTAHPVVIVPSHTSATAPDQ